ncbi:MAG: hypothetical protein WCK65_11290 [Rhodospirillaceae bacterium]
MVDALVSDFITRHSSILALLYSYVGLEMCWEKVMSIIYANVPGCVGGFVGVIDQKTAKVSTLLSGVADAHRWLGWRIPNELVGSFQRQAVAYNHFINISSDVRMYLFVASLVGDRFHDVIIVLSLDRPFSDDVHRFLDFVLPHLRNLFAIHVRVTGLSIRMTDLRSVIDVIDSAIVLARRSGDYFLANKAGEELLRRNDGLMISRGQLRALNQVESSCLREAMAGVGREVCARSLLITRLGGEMKYLVHVIALPPPIESKAVIGAEVAVVLTAANGTRIPTKDALVALGLTPAEVRLSLSLASGERLGEFAEKHAVSKDTARSQLLSLFRKTGTSRQADVISFLQGLASISLKLKN